MSEFGLYYITLHTLECVYWCHHNKDTWGELLLEKSRVLECILSGYGTTNDHAEDLREVLRYQHSTAFQPRTGEGE